MSNEIKSTREEEKFIRAFRRLAKKMPDSVWLFADGGNIKVMQKNEEDLYAHRDDGGVDPDYILETIAIEADGGDW